MFCTFGATIHSCVVALHVRWQEELKAPQDMPYPGQVKGTIKLNPRSVCFQLKLSE
jgi:hypothetical protein